MAQLFRPVSNTLARLLIPAAPLLGAAILVALNVGMRTDWTGRELARAQPVPFSHLHHVDGLGLDCRHCHPGVEDEAHAGMPATDVCMTCHRQIWAKAPVLAPVRDSAATGEPLRWRRVHDLPDYVYFHHAIHVRQGVGCSTCHGRVDRMTVTRQVAALDMQWCLDCHRDPAPFLRPRDAVLDMGWQPPPDQAEAGRRRLREYGIQPELLDDCGLCHR